MRVCCSRRRYRCCSWARSLLPQRRSCSSAISAPSWRCRCRMAAGVNSSALPPSRTMPRWRVFRIPMPNRLSSAASCAGRSGSRRRIESGWISSANYWHCGGTTWRRTCRRRMHAGSFGIRQRGVARRVAIGRRQVLVPHGAFWRSCRICRRCPKRGLRCFPWAPSAAAAPQARLEPGAVIATLS